MSTPLRNKKQGKARKSLNKNSFVKRKATTAVTKQHSKEKAKGQLLVQTSQQKGRYPQGQGPQKVQRYRYQHPTNVPPPPPPPPPPPYPPPPAQPPANGNKANQIKRNSQLPNKENGRPIKKHNKQNENRASHPRNRTAGDVRRWLHWRQDVNEHLASYVLSNNDTQRDTTSLANFPKDFTAESIDAILHHAYTKENPKSSLDKLSYMIYGVPRICLSGRSKEYCMKFTHDSSYAESFSDEGQCPLSHQAANKNGISRCSSQISGGRLPRQEVKGNLFIQTNPPSNIQRFLPEPRYQGPNERHEASNRVSRSSSRSYATYHPEPHSPMSSRGKPPVVGAVPTLLSGLQPYEMAQLKPVTRERRY